MPNAIHGSQTDPTIVQRSCLITSGFSIFPTYVRQRSQVNSSIGPNEYPCLSSSLCRRPNSTKQALQCHFRNGSMSIHGCIGLCHKCLQRGASGGVSETSNSSTNGDNPISGFVSAGKPRRWLTIFRDSAFAAESWSSFRCTARSFLVSNLTDSKPVLHSPRMILTTSLVERSLFHSH